MLQATITNVAGEATMRNRDGVHISIRGESTNGEKPIFVEIRMTRAEAKQVLHEIQNWLNP